MSSAMTKMQGIIIVLVIVVAAAGGAYTLWPRPPEQVKLTFIFHWSDAEWIEVVEGWIADYRAENPDVEIEYISTGFAELYTKITTLHAAGETPDIISFYTLWLPEFVEAGMLAEPAGGLVDVDEYYPASIEGCTYDGTLWGYPTELCPYGLVVNTRLLDEAGVEIPETWDDLADAAVALTKYEDDAVNQSGYGWNTGYMSGIVHQFLSQLWSNGGEYLDLEDKKALFNSTEGVETLQAWYDLIYTHKVWSSDLSAADLMPLESMAMTVAASWWRWTLVTQMGDAFEHITVAPIPRAPDGDFVTITYCWMFGVSDASEHKEEAWDFLEFVNKPQAGAEISRLGEYFAHQVGAFPSRISDVENQEEFTEEWYSKMADLFQYGRAEPRFVGSEGVKLALYHEIELVLFEGKDPKQALDDAAAEVNRLLAEQ